VPLLAGQADVVVPDLRGFGDSDQHPVVLAGYDIGSRDRR